jgi:myosin heavy subunit
MENISTQVFHIRDLPTASVTLYPSRAHIVRDIASVELQPGQNEIEIYGLSPTVDENSIQIEGRGSAATITDITVDLVPNRDDFLETFPEDSDSEVTDSEEYEDSDDEIDSVRTISSKIKATERYIERQLEVQRSAERQLQTLNQHSKSINAAKCDPDHLAQTLKVYQDQRQRLFEASSKATDSLRNLQKQKKRLEAQREKAGQDEQKRKKETERTKQKLKAKQLRLKQERQIEAARVKSERIKFWPHKVYRVVVRLETITDTPQTPRRNSFDSVTLANATPEVLDKVLAAEKLQPIDLNVSLLLSYVTTSAYWSPRYDLSLSSVQKTATIVYRAEFSNGTSETWKDAKVILSTSQTSYSGLEDKAPTMQAWNVKLGKTFDGSNGLLSNDETPAVKLQTALVQKSRKAQLLGGAMPNSEQKRSS